MTRQRAGLLGRQAACVAALFAVWQLAAVTGLAPPRLLPPVTSVFGELARLAADPEFWEAVGETLMGALWGLLASCAVAIPLGLLAGLSRRVEQSTRVVMDFGRAFPAIALLSVVLLLFGATGTAKSIIVFAACVFPLFIQTLYGARRIEPSIAEAARSYRIPARLYLLRVALPSATPSVMTGMRLAAVTAVLVAVGTEVIGGMPGLGHQLAMAQQQGAPDVAYAYILVAGILGFAVTRGTEVAEARFLRWRPSHVS